MRRPAIYITLSLMAMGCSQMYSQRSFLAEMEHDDSTFFSPREDFPVVAGDTGRFWNSEKTRNKRTPASLHDVEKDQSQRSLERELKSLENSQSEKALSFYDKHKSKLHSTSERIYFLKLPHNERADYLQSRGLLDQPSQNFANTHQERMFALRNADLLPGMTKDEVVDSWGKPVRVEIAGNPSYENERWVYKMNGATKYIYFESGQVQGWE